MILGLVVGKPVGILGTAVLAVVLRLGRLPTGANWRDLPHVGAPGLIGFTVSIFIDGLAFVDPVIDAAKMGVLASSLGCQGARRDDPGLPAGNRPSAGD